MRKAVAIRLSAALLVSGAVVYAAGRVLDRVAGNVPVRFYGRIADQEGRGVPGVPVTASVTVNDLIQVPVPVPQATQRVVTTTADADGNFVIDGGTGRSVQVDPFHLPGHVQPGRDQRYFVRSGPASASDRAGATAAGRHTFHVWRKGPIESLVADQVKCEGGDRAGRPFVVDLLHADARQDPAAAGDVRVAISCPDDPRGRRGPFDWTFAIEAVDGGLVETTDLFPFLAPESGYRPRYEYAMRADGSAGPRSDEVQRTYYLRSRNGQVYAALRVYARPGSGAGPLVFIRYVANPAGSRNLEAERGLLR